MQHKTRWITICLAAAFCTGTVGATTITSLNTSGYTWPDEISGSVSDVALPTSSPWTAGNFSFSSSSNDVSAQNIYLNYVSPTPGLTTSSGDAITITTPSGGETALSLSIYNKNGSLNGGEILTVTLSDGEVFTPYGGAFWFSSSTPITSVTVSAASGNQPIITQLSYALSSLPPDGGGDGGSPSPVPEPATVLLVSAGGLIFFGARRWFRREA